MFSKFLTKLSQIQFNWDYFLSHRKIIAIVSSISSVLFYAITQVSVLSDPAIMQWIGVESSTLTLFFALLYAISTFTISFVASLIAAYIQLSKALDRLNATYQNIDVWTDVQINAALQKTDHLLFIRLSRSIQENIDLKEIIFNKNEWSYHINFVDSEAVHQRARQSVAEMFGELIAKNDASYGLVKNLSTLQFALRKRDDFQKIVNEIRGRLSLLFGSGIDRFRETSTLLTNTQSIILIGTIESERDFILYQQLLKRNNKEQCSIRFKTIIFNTTSETINPIVHGLLAEDLGVKILKYSVSQKELNGVSDIVINEEPISGFETENLNAIATSLNLI